MIVEGVRLIADWLADQTYGVAAQLAAMTFDGSDQAPEVPAITDETRNDAVAEGRTADAANGPALGVVALPLEDASNTVAQPARDLTLRVAVMYASKEPNTADARRDSYYVLRAVLLSLRALALQSDSAARTRGAIALVGLDELRLEPAPPDPLLVDNGIYGQVVAGWTAIDLAAT